MGDNRKALVLGMARSGYEAAKFLIDKGYRVVLNDAKADQNPDQVKELEALGVEVVLGSHPEHLLDGSWLSWSRTRAFPITIPTWRKP